MPTVPRLTAPQVAPAIIRTPSTPAIAEPEAAVAQTLGAFGQMFQRERERQAEIRLTAAESDARLLRQQIATDVTALQGVNALNAVEQAEQRYRDGVTKIESELRDPAVRRQFQMRAKILGGELVERARSHALQQSEAVDEARTKANLADDLEQLSSADLTDADAIVERMSLNQRSYLTRKGLPTEAVDQSVRELVSAARVSQIQALVDQNNTEAAKTLLEEKSGQFLPKDIEKARNLVTDADMVVQAQQAEDTILAEFGDNERDALKAVRERYSDKMRDMVEMRVERRYATAERLRREDIEAVSTRAEQAVYQRRPIARQDRLFLLENNPRALSALERLSLSLEKQTPITTDWSTYYELSNMPQGQFRDTNLMEYRDRLDDGEFKQLIDRQAELRGTGGRRPREGGMTSVQVKQELFTAAAQKQLFSGNPNTLGQIKPNTTNSRRMTELSEAVQEEIDRRTEKEGPLSKTQVREAIQAVIDATVLDDGGWLGRERLIMTPPAMNEPQNYEQMATTPAMLQLSPADRWEALIRQGVPKDTATALINRTRR